MSSNEKLDLASPNFVNENFEKLASLFPNCVTESADGKAIDFDLLKQELSHEVVEGNKERYRLEWPGKREAIVTANLPTTKTLRPVREDSVDFDNTENLYIEGDNLEVLKLLQESYLGKVKMIYIDPPYNTGGDFVYKDNFTKDTQEELLDSGQKDEYSQRLVVNPETGGRFHSDWLSMMYPRLKLARNLLASDGVVYISIDDNEIHNLRKICDEIFGIDNSRGTIIRSTGTRMGSGNKDISSEVDYVLIYSKSSEFEFSPLSMSEDDLKIYDQHDEKGRYLTRSLRRTGGENRREDRPSMFYPVFSPDGTEVYPLAPEGWESRWVCGKETYERLLSEGMIEWKRVPKDGKDEWKIYQKHYIGEAVKYASNSWDNIEGNKKATREVNKLFDGMKYFNHPKPVDFLSRILAISNLEKNEIVLDFFSGSGSTAHAVINSNAKDLQNIRFIQVQLPEPTSEKSEAFKAGYKNICEIGKERIRRASKKIKEETKADIDYGFRVYRLDDSNMQDVYYKPQEYAQDSLELFSDNVKPDRTADDLLAQVMLDWGLPLSLKIEQKTIEGKHVFKVSENSLYACFDDGIDEVFAKTIAKDQPLRIVFKDSGFKDDTAKTNVKQLLKQLSPETEMKVI
ncbi:site-specific DNA-methyltransferase [Seonamhaeicola sp. MEBiC1930]|uniref:site-specific DNA-methyltransferase n=1 Tax=Seonamhaeicola sp. MEBiC01930 TaxID=2976768 RepID=UPI00324A32BD